jgi:hypothetical protein
MRITITDKNNTLLSNEYQIRSAHIKDNFIELELISVFPSCIEVIKFDLNQYDVEIKEK